MTEQPTVYIVLGEGNLRSAMAYEEGGEVLETVDFTEDNLPDWAGGGYCDHRGGGGPEGYDALVRALDAAEENAKSIGFAVKRVPREEH